MRRQHYVWLGLITAAAGVIGFDLGRHQDRRPMPVRARCYEHLGRDEYGQVWGVRDGRFISLGMPGIWDVEDGNALANVAGQWFTGHLIEVRQADMMPEREGDDLPPPIDREAQE